MSIHQELEDQLCAQLNAPLASLAKVMPWPEDMARFASPKGVAYVLVRFQAERVMGDPSAGAQRDRIMQTSRHLFEVRMLMSSLVDRAEGYKVLAGIKEALSAFAPTIAAAGYAAKLPGFYLLEQGLMPTKTQGIREFAAIYGIDIRYIKRS